jgi:hypothetical protein
VRPGGYTTVSPTSNLEDLRHNNAEDQEDEQKRQKRGEKNLQPALRHVENAGPDQAAKSHEDHGDKRQEVDPGAARAVVVRQPLCGRLRPLEKLHGQSGGDHQLREKPDDQTRPHAHEHHEDVGGHQDRHDVTRDQNDSTEHLHTLGTRRTPSCFEAG